MYFVDRAVAGQHRVGDQPHRDAAGLPAAGDQALEGAGFGRFRIGMEPLRIPVAGEAQQLVLGQHMRAGLEDLADMELGELHAASPVCRAQTRRRSHGLTR